MTTSGTHGDDDSTEKSERGGADRRAPLHELLLGVLTREAMQDVDLPHAVVCLDPVTGVASYSGPYDNGLAALWAAESDHQDDLAAEIGGPSMVFSVVPLCRPRELGPRQVADPD